MSRLRHITQLFSLLLVNIGFIEVLKTGIVCPFFYCYGCPWAAFACPIGILQTNAALGPFPFYAIGLLGLFGIALGRFWCGWGCPFGTFQDLIVWLRRRKDIINLPAFGWSRLIVLVGALIAAWMAADTLFCKICPAGSLFAAIPQRLTEPELPFGTFFYVHLITLAISLVLFFLIGRFWCRYLCPLGGLLGLFNRVSVVKVKLDLDKCTHCKQCLVNCPVNIKNPEDVGNSSDCIQCGKCINSCSMDAIRVSASLND